MDLSLHPTDILPHRPPFLFVDRIVQLEQGMAIATVSFPAATPFFGGHFPDTPLVPGVILLEALAQAAGLAAMSPDEPHGELGARGYLAQIREARFRNVVGPDQEIRLEARLVRRIQRLFLFDTTASSGGKTLVEAQLTLMRD
jgi:3-hydroxyacyl-[acyl-carrier-protein] dehydratase